MKFQGMRLSIGVLLFAFLLAPILVNANGVSTPITMQSTDTKYRNEVIGDARFGDADARKIIEQSFGFEKEVNQAIMGQEEPVAALHATLMQYLDGFQARKSSAGVPPLARHLIGFPGIGKSALIDYLRKILPVVQIDAQAYSTPEAIRDLSYSLESNQILKAKKPVILLIDEVDKLREIVPGQPEKTVPFIGALNQLLNEGRISGRSEIDLSHVLVVTTMNLPTEVIEEFSEQVLTTQKNFFDFTVEDFDKFSKWIDQDDSAIYKILARMYRTNTVTRLAANALIMNHLSNAIYHRIIEGTVRAAIKRQTEGSASARRISVEYSPRLVEFLYERTVFAPTGARDTVIKVNNIVEQLISYGMRGIGPNKSFASLKRPRKLFLDISPDGKGGLIQVTAQKRNGKILVDEPAFSIVTEYNKRMSAFLVPPDVLATRPIEAKDISHIVTQTMIRDVRYPKSEDKAKGLADQIGLRVYGQEETANKFEAEFSSYLSASSSLREPRSLVIAGVPGVGKSEIVLVTGEVLKLPVVRVNLQQFSSSGDDAPVKFLDTLEREIAKIKGKSPDGKYILLLEEMDKIDEIDPSGNPKDRPIITVVKDILDRGTSTLTVKGSYGGTQERNIDVREAFTIATMNFNGKIFDFKADPRLTTIEDVTRACKKINMSIGERKKVLEKMFRPDTINRMISRMIIMMPLQKEHYYKVIQAQFADVLEQRFRDKKGRNVGRVVLKPDQSFLDYLYNEAVIPSEGARFTKDVSKRLIQFSLDRPMKIVPNKFRAQPYEIALSFDWKNTAVKSNVKVISLKTKVELAEFKDVNPVALAFPDPNLHGKIPAERIMTALHEFGHAYASVLLGVRIELIAAISSQAGVGGLVKFTPGDGAPHASQLIAKLYSFLASRAFERMYFSKDPLNEKSVVDITTGPSGDIQQATRVLFNLIYKLGFDPQGGTIDAQGGDGVSDAAKYADFDKLPQETVVKLGQILRDMENSLLHDFTAMHSRQWYKEKIVAVARAGYMSEGQFYDLLGLPRPPEEVELGLDIPIYEEFADVIFPDGRVEVDKSEALSSMAKVMAERRQVHVDKFVGLLREHLHANATANSSAQTSESANQCRAILGSK